MMGRVENMTFSIQSFMNNKNKANKIRIGQTFKKKDTGQIITITGKRTADYYTTAKKSGSSMVHSIHKKDLARYWEIIN